MTCNHTSFRIIWKIHKNIYAFFGESHRRPGQKAGTPPVRPSSQKMGRWTQKHPLNAPNVHIFGTVGALQSPTKREKDLEGEPFRYGQGGWHLTSWRSRSLCLQHLAGFPTCCGAQRRKHLPAQKERRPTVTIPLTAAVATHSTMLSRPNFPLMRSL